MKYLRQFCVILLFSALGEVLHFMIPLPVPASVYGLILLLAALLTGLVKPSQVENAADFLIEIMPVMFVPAGVGLITAWGELQTMLLPITVITIVTTILVMAVTGLITQAVLHRKKEGKTNADHRR